MKILNKIMTKLWASMSTLLEITGFGLIAWGIGSFNIPLSAIICGILLIIAGGLSA